MKENIAIYGWAFNPPTIWHESVIEKVLVSYKVHKLIFAPDWERLDKNYWIEREHRIKMLEVFFHSLKAKWLRVEFDDYFLVTNKEKTNTMSVEEYFIQKLWIQPFHIFWIDVAQSMSTWDWNKDCYIEHKLKKIFLTRKWYEVPKDLNMSNYEIINLDTPEVSSTLARSVVNNRDHIKRIVPQAVYDYIHANDLYNCNLVNV